MDAPSTKSPHVLIIPFPAQGHVNSMLKLAELLCLSDIHVTFVLSHKIHDSLLRHSNIQTRLEKYPGFHLETLPKELYDGKVHTAEEVRMLHNSLQVVVKRFSKELLTNPESGITCIIADGILSVVLDVGEEVGVPVFYFITISASCFWAYFSIPQLIEAGDFPYTDDDMDVSVTNVKGMEQILRRRDFPSFSPVTDLTTPDFKMLNEIQQTTRAKGVILNTFDELEGNILSHVRNRFSNVYAIGPGHSFLKSPVQTTSTNSLLKEDRSCMKWLDRQDPKSVLYVSFGSTTILTNDQILEFWHGVVNSGTRFLWVIRPDSIKGINGENNTPMVLDEATKDRGYFVQWAPQEEVLGHPSVGGFLTHSGWNSTIESIVEGVPMICWPFLGDQRINSRFVEKVWELGIDIKDTCDRLIIENAVRDLMIVRKNEFAQRANEMSEFARQAVNEGGSSSCSFNKLVEDIRSN